MRRQNHFGENEAMFEGLVDLAFTLTIFFIIVMELSGQGFLDRILLPPRVEESSVRISPAIPDSVFVVFIDSTQATEVTYNYHQGLQRKTVNHIIACDSLMNGIAYYDSVLKHLDVFIQNRASRDNLVVELMAQEKANWGLVIQILNAANAESLTVSIDAEPVRRE